MATSTHHTPMANGHLKIVVADGRVTLEDLHKGTRCSRPACCHPDNLVASVAQFELALLTVRQGDPRTHVIRWDIEPHAMLTSLARGIPLVEDSQKGAYEIVVSRDIPSLFQNLFSTRDQHHSWIHSTS